MAGAQCCDLGWPERNVPREEPAGSQGAVLVTGLRSFLGRRHGPSTPDGFLHAGALATGSGKPGRAVQLALVSVLLPDVVFAGRSILQTQLGPGPEQLGRSSECLDAPFLPILCLPVLSPSFLPRAQAAPTQWGQP